jgi:hypothetical protein
MLCSKSASESNKNGKIFVFAGSNLNRCSNASVVNNYEDNSWAFVVITCLFA